MNLKPGDKVSLLGNFGSVISVDHMKKFLLIEATASVVKLSFSNLALMLKEGSLKVLDDKKDS